MTLTMLLPRRPTIPVTTTTCPAPRNAAEHTTTMSTTSHQDSGAYACFSFSCPFFPYSFQASRKVSQRTKPPPIQSLTSNPDRPPKIEDEPRPTSSDLDDCEDVWTGELRDYMLETQKRKKQVERWFEANFLVCHGRTLHTFS
jgi:hypothetical protein